MISCKNCFTGIKSTKGLTLIELIIVITLMGILLTLAGVSYISWVRRARVKEAISMLNVLYRSAIEYNNRKAEFKQCQDRDCLQVYNPGALDSYMTYFNYAIKQESNQWVIIATGNGKGGFDNSQTLKVYLEESRRGEWGGNLLSYK